MIGSKFKQLGQALEELKKAIYEDSQYIMIQKLKTAGKRGSRAGKKLHKIIQGGNK